MSIDLLLAVVGVVVTIMVVVGMILITPSGVEGAPAHVSLPDEPATDRDPIPVEA